MMSIAEELELKRNFVVIQCIYGKNSNNYNELDIKKLANTHYKKIDISDDIYVVNVGGYIGESTRKEIEYAESLRKKILSLEQLN